MAKKQKSTPYQSVVYSTNPNYIYDNREGEEQETLPPQQQNLKVQREKKGRGGKEATIIRNFEGSDNDLKELAKLLKQFCGVGGSAKDGEIILQGDTVEKALSYLTKQGYKAKKSGG